MISDINKSTSQDLFLIDSKMKELRELLAVADRKIATAKKEKEQSVAVENFQKEINLALSNEKKEPLLPQNPQKAYMKVPVYTPKVTVPEKTIVPQKPLGTMIHELYAEGLSIEEIARKIGKSTTVVSMVIDMSL